MTARSSSTAEAETNRNGPTDVVERCDSKRQVSQAKRRPRVRSITSMGRGSEETRGPLVFEGWQGLQDFRGLGPVENRIVFADFPVAEHEHTLGEQRDVMFMGNQYDR